MKFFPYPITAANLAEFTRPGSELFSDIIFGSLKGGSVNFAGNGFIAVADFSAIDSDGVDVYDFPKSLARFNALPWDLIDDDFRPPHAKHFSNSMNRKINSWVPFDDHSGFFSEYRDQPLFTPDGRPIISHYFEIGQGRVRVPVQVLNLVRKLPRSVFWSPRITAVEEQKFLPIRFNGGLALIGSVSKNTLRAHKAKRAGGICAGVSGANIESGL